MCVCSLRQVDKHRPRTNTHNRKSLISWSKLAIGYVRCIAPAVLPVIIFSEAMLEFPPKWASRDEPGIGDCYLLPTTPQTMLLCLDAIGERKINQTYGNRLVDGGQVSQ